MRSTDFFTDLEAQLMTAHEQRAARRLPNLPRPTLAVGLALVAAAIAIAALLVALSDGDSPTPTSNRGVPAGTKQSSFTPPPTADHDNRIGEPGVPEAPPAARPCPATKPGMLCPAVPAPATAPRPKRNRRAKPRRVAPPVISERGPALAPAPRAVVPANPGPPRAAPAPRTAQPPAVRAPRAKPRTAPRVAAPPAARAPSTPPLPSAPSGGSID